MPSQLTTLSALLLARVGDPGGWVFLDDDGAVAHRVSFAEAERRSRAFAAPARSAAVSRGIAFAFWSSSFAWSIFSVSPGSSPATPANAE